MILSPPELTKGAPEAFAYLRPFAGLSSAILESKFVAVDVNRSRGSGVKNKGSKNLPSSKKAVFILLRKKAKIAAFHHAQKSPDRMTTSFANC